MLQLLPLILVPFVAVVQSCRYMLYVDSAEVSVPNSCHDIMKDIKYHAT